MSRTIRPGKEYCVRCLFWSEEDDSAPGWKQEEGSVDVRLKPAPPGGCPKPTPRPPSPKYVWREGFGWARPDSAQAAALHTPIAVPNSERARQSSRAVRVPSRFADT